MWWELLLSFRLNLRHDFPTVIVTASRAHMVRKFHFTAVGALNGLDLRQGVMGTTHVAAGFGGFPLRNGHIYINSTGGIKKPRKVGFYPKKTARARSLFIFSAKLSKRQKD